MSKMGLMALDGGDPRLGTVEGTFAGQGIVSYTRPQMRALHDPSVSFEEYHYYAQQTRAVEDANIVSRSETRGILSTIIPNLKREVPEEKRRASMIPNVNFSDPSRRASVTDEEWINASRAVRTATAGAIFCKIFSFFKDKE